jgi:hypothetical protein
MAKYKTYKQYGGAFFFRRHARSTEELDSDCTIFWPNSSSLLCSTPCCRSHRMFCSTYPFWGSSFNDGTTQTARDPLILGGRLAPLKSVYFGSNEGRGPVPSVQP